MKLEDQVVSLELAKKLKELGVKQESLFWWKNNSGKEKDWYVEFGNEFGGGRSWKLSAFTVAELGEMFPSYISSRKSIADSDAGNIKKGFVIINEEMKIGEPRYRHDKSEANARAKMMIYLIENKLIDL